MINKFLFKAGSPVLFLLLILTAGTLWAQTVRPPVGTPGTANPGVAATGDKVELIHADSLNVLNQPGAVVRKLIRNVKLQQKGVVLYCDIAIQNTTTNVIEAYGNVRMVQGDTITVRGDTLYYYGNTRQANVLGSVVLKDRKMTLNTARLDYDLLSGVAHYPVKGRIIDRENILTSDEGYYDTRTKQFIFQHNVRLLNQPPGKEKTTILADSLLYNSLSKIADFQGPTRIISKDGTLVARNGQYNTTTRVSNFRQRATAETDKYTLTGDTLNFDNVNEVGIAHGNVVIVNKADKTTLTGDHGRYNGKAGVSRMIGHAVVRSPISQGAAVDTLFMRADTLFSFDNKLTKRKKIIGQKNVLVFKSDLQSKCDSLVYDVSDSLLYFYKKPIVWSQNYQMEADSMTAKLKNNRINTLFLKTRSFVISQDTLRNFNQVKGRQITAHFRTILAPVKKTDKPAGAMTASVVNRPTPSPVVTTTAAEQTTLDRVLVEGNGQTIYFAVDEKNRLVGMNRTECSKMNIEFTNSRVTRIRNYGRPDMYLTPPKELTEDKKQLDGFRWREKEKPTKEQTLGLTPATDTKPAPPENVVAMLNDKANSGAVVAGKALLTAVAGNLPPNKASQVAASAVVSKLKLPVVTKAVAIKPAAAKPVASKLTAPASNTLTAPILPKAPVKTTEPVASLSVPVKLIADGAEHAPTGRMGAEPVTRTPLLSKAVHQLAIRTFTLLPVKKPVIPTEPLVGPPLISTNPVTDKPTVGVEAVATEAGFTKTTEPAATEQVTKAVLGLTGEPVTAKPTSESVVSSANKPADAIGITPAKPTVSVSSAESAKPVTSSSSKNTLLTRRTDKKKKTAVQVVPVSKLKVESIIPGKEESDLELQLNRKQKRQ